MGRQEVAVRWALRQHDGLNSKRKLILTALAFYTRKSSCYVLLSRLSEDAHLSENVCRASVLALEELGYLTIESRAGRSKVDHFQLSLNMAKRPASAAASLP